MLVPKAQATRKPAETLRFCQPCLNFVSFLSYSFKFFCYLNLLSPQKICICYNSYRGKCHCYLCNDWMQQASNSHRDCYGVICKSPEQILLYFSESCLAQIYCYVCARAQCESDVA